MVPLVAVALSLVDVTLVGLVIGLSTDVACFISSWVACSWL